MTLEEIVDALDDTKKIEMAIEFLKIALSIWENYCKNPETDLSYYAFLLGINYVDPNIVKESIDLASKIIIPHPEEIGLKILNRIKEIYKDFNEHISGINDFELEMDYKARLVFYSAYNLICFLNGDTHSHSNEHNAFISVNQSIDSIIKSGISDWDKMRELVSKY